MTKLKICISILVNTNIGGLGLDCCKLEHEKIREKIQKSSKFNCSVEKLSKIFSMLGDTTRMKIILALMEGELCVYHICDIVNSSQSAVSQHLRKLKDYGLVKCKKDANLVLYSIADDHVRTIVKTALEHKDCK